jgi:hypothetical protein
LHQRSDQLVELGDLVREVEDPPRQAAERDPGRGVGVAEGDRVRARRGQAADQLHAAATPELVPDRVGRGDDRVAQLLQRRAARYRGHSIQDTLDELSRRSVAAVGETLVELVRALDDGQIDALG